MKRRLFVGIDPGVHTGFAIWNAGDQTLQDVASMGAIDAMVLVQSMHGFGNVAAVHFEDARLRTGWFGDRAKQKLQGAGSIKRDCQLWADWLDWLKCPYRAISPKAKGSKMNSEQFQRITGWLSRTNEHGRDAAALVIGLR